MVPRPQFRLAGGGGGFWGLEGAALGDGDVAEALDGTVLCGCLRGGGSCWGQGGSGCSGPGALEAAVVAPAAAPFLTAGDVCAGVRWWCGCCCRQCCGWRWRSGCCLGPGLGLGTGSRWRRTSPRRCVGSGVGRVGLPVRCLGAGVARVAARGEVEDDEEDEDEEKAVVLGDAGCASMQAGAALRAAAVSAALNAGRMEGISLACGSVAGGWRGLAATERPGRPI